MGFQQTEEEISRIKQILAKKNIKISRQEIASKVDLIIHSQDAYFPLKHQRALLIQLLHNYEKSKKKEVIILEELKDESLPPTIMLGVAAVDWPGMSNAILGIVHHDEGNVSFMKGLSIHLGDNQIGVVILCVRLNTEEQYRKFKSSKKRIEEKIREASHGSSGKTQFLEDETVKFEIYNSIIARFMDMYSNSDLIRLIEESGEIQKFISSRSREYLEARTIKDLANLIINNYIFQNMIRSGVAEEVIKVKNFKTREGEFTGITFVCREGWISIEDFLMTLNHIVPDHIIKHHKSFVTVDDILVYRIEITDRYEKPLNSNMIKTIEKSMDKLVNIAHANKIAKLKAIGGFEHYARAIIPFLIEELKKTGMTQVFIDVARRSEFAMDLKMVLVSAKSRKKRIQKLSAKVCLIPGVSIGSIIPTKYHGDTEINILRLKVSLSEFDSIKELYRSIRKIVRDIYGSIRDFDEGFRDIYINRLNQLLEKLKNINPALIREIFFNIDELYKIEMPFPLMTELCRLCAQTIDCTREKPDENAIFRYKNLTELRRTIVVVSYGAQKRLMSRLIKELTEVELYFTKIEWNQRSYLLMVLRKDRNVVSKEFTANIRRCIKQYTR